MNGDVAASFLQWVTGVIFAGFAYLLYYALIGSKNVNKNISVE